MNQAEKTKTKKSSKKGFPVWPVLTTLFILAALILGYFYYNLYQDYQALLTNKTALENQLETSTSELEDSLANKDEEIESLKEDEAKLEKDKDSFKSTIDSKEAKISQADKYNEVLVYLSNLIKEHDSLVEWSEAEYQEVRRLALATENDDVVERVDWVYENRDIGLLIRHYQLLNDITTSLDQTLN